MSTQNIICFTQMGVEIVREMLHVMGYRIPFKSKGYFVGIESMVYKVNVITKEVRVDEEISQYNLQNPNNYRAMVFINRYLSRFES